MPLLPNTAASQSLQADSIPALFSLRSPPLRAWLGRSLPPCPVQYENDVIVAINDVSVLGKDATELAHLIHNGTSWYSGLDSVSTVTILGGGGPADGVLPAGQYAATEKGKKQTIVVSHLGSDVIETRPALPHRTDRVDLIEPRPCPVEPVCSDSVGALACERPKGSGPRFQLDLSPGFVILLFCTRSFFHACSGQSLAVAA